MDKIKLKEQAETIRQAFGYINRFAGRTFVIKIDGGLFGNPGFPLFIKDLVLLQRMGIKIILVPGAKQRIDEILSTFKVDLKIVDGVRITTQEAMPFINMAAFDVSNRLMNLLAENRANAVIGNWVKARGIGVKNGVDYHNSGIVEKLDAAIVNSALDDNLIPIFPNIGWNALGKPYNLSSNELAFTIAREMQAAKLFFVTDSGGIASKGCKIPRGVYVSSENIISQMTVDQARLFLEQNHGTHNTAALEFITLAYRACSSGVERVHIIDGRTDGMILKEIFSNRGFGTMIYANQHDNIRPMAHPDIPDVLRIMQPSVDDGTLIERSVADLEAGLSDYAVYEVDDTVHGCIALHQYKNGQAEIAGVAVDELYSNLGIGKKLISYCIDRAIRQKLKQVFILTTQTADWFLSIGFTLGTLKSLPKEKQVNYNSKRKSKILLYKITGKPGKNISIL